MGRVLVPLVTFQERILQVSGSDVKVEKTMSEIMGIPMGPPTLPSIGLTPSKMEELRNLMIGFGWPLPD